MRRLLPLLVLASSLACAPGPAPGTWAQVRDLTPPFLAGTYGADAAVATDATGRIAITWVTRDSSGATDLWLSVSSDSGARFSPPRRVNERAGKVMSYPESRALAAFGPGGRLALVWSTARDSGALASDIVVRVSPDGGTTLGPESIVNDDAHDPRSPYHGFADLAWVGASRLVVAWIDGRDSPLAEGEEEPHMASVYLDASDDGGRTWGADTRAAVDVCPCCRLTLRASAGESLALTYRGARADLRDPRLAFSPDGGRQWRADSVVSRDAWHLEGCPVSGPGLVADRGASEGWVAWFTGAEPAAHGGPAGIYLSPWRAVGDSGLVFGPRQAVADSLDALARPQLAWVAGRPWLAVQARERIEPQGPALLAMRRIGEDGNPGRWLVLGAGVRSFALAPLGARRALATWTEEHGEGPRERVAAVTESPVP